MTDIQAIIEGALNVETIESVKEKARRIEIENKRLLEDRDYYRRNWDTMLLRYERLLDEHVKLEAKLKELGHVTPA